MQCALQSFQRSGVTGEGICVRRESLLQGGLPCFVELGILLTLCLNLTVEVHRGYDEQRNNSDTFCIERLAQL